MNDARINELGATLREAWPHGTVSLSSHRDGRGYGVWLHRGTQCLSANGDTPSEALSLAITLAGQQWPDEEAVRRQALKDAERSLAKARADLEALEAEAA